MSVDENGERGPLAKVPLLILMGVLLILLSPMNCLCTAGPEQPGSIRVKVLLENENISSSCLGTVVNAGTGAVAFLSPEGDVLSAVVTPGQYDVVVLYPQDASLMPQLLSITVAPGQTADRSVSLSDHPNVFGMPGDEEDYLAGMPDGDDGPSYFPVFDTGWPDDDGAAKGGDGDWLAPGEEEEPASPLGEVLIEWEATCQTRETQSDYYAFDDSSPYFPGEHSEDMDDHMQVTYSGSCRYKVMGIIDGCFNLEDGQGTVQRIGGGSGHLSQQDLETHLCIRGDKWTERQFKSTRHTSMEHHVKDRDVSPPYVYIYPSVCEIGLPPFYQASDGWTEVIAESRLETCDGVETTSYENTLDSGPPLCELVISQALSSPDFKEQLRFSRPQGADFSINGHAAWDLNRSELGLLGPVDDGVEHYAVQGSLRFSYTVTYTSYPADLEDYDEWMPEADEDGQSRGNSI